jgi:hypothetical protein
LVGPASRHHSFLESDLERMQSLPHRIEPRQLAESGVREGLREDA